MYDIGTIYYLSINNQVNKLFKLSFVRINCLN